MYKFEIKRANCNFEREPLKIRFGFKGSYLTELWQTAVLLESKRGGKYLGLGTQSVLWADAELFYRYSEAVSNSLMFLVTNYAANRALHSSATTPIEVIEEILPDVYRYAQTITQKRDLQSTFVLNALVPLDNALWLMYAGEHSISNFSKLIPTKCQTALNVKNEKLLNIPLVNYNTSPESAEKLARAGFHILKIKIGKSFPSETKMLSWDIERVIQVHQRVKEIESPYTNSGHVMYYLDINGQYREKKTLLRFLDAMEKNHIMNRIILLEEPFPETQKIDVTNIPVRIATDESAHSREDVRERIDLGYSAIALKPIAKTLSITFKMIEETSNRNIPCFCADLTVNPILVDWNKNLAARLSPLPEMKIGILESNGNQNYKNWNKMIKYHPLRDREWINCESGIFKLNEEFYSNSGGIFKPSKHYLKLVEP